MWCPDGATRCQIQALTGFCLNWEGGRAIKLAMKRWGVPILSVALLALAPDAGAQSERDALIAKHASVNGVPESLVRRVIHIESRGNPRVVSKGNYGLMQIRLGTARAMGYSGTAQGLLDPDTNMTYAVKYLAGAYRAAGCNADRAVSYYQRGYYKKAMAKCGSPQPSPTQTARAETNALARPADRFERRPAPARPALESAAMQSTDVLRPKVVQTLLITRPKPTTASSQAIVKVKAVAVPTPPVRPSDAKLLSPEPISKQSPEPAAPQAVARLEPEAVPLPPVVNRELIPASKKTVSPIRHRRAPAGKKAEAPVNLLSFLKKLVTPETKQRGHRHASHARR
jgi:hypothetical protein